MHGLDASIEHLRKAGDFGDIANGNAGFAQKPRSTAGGNQIGAEGMQAARKIGN